ncbi:MAG: DUF1993 domain-containing protein [Gammaproteobacteria bacterium]|nr:DUF1993 domain-containing protein [Gammaproteobacteria bacterium]
MSFSIYQVTVPQLLHMLTNFSSILKKAAAYAEAKKIDPAIFINARLAPDMFSLDKQVQIVSDTAKGCVARLADIEIPRFEDNEKTFDELQERITNTVQFIESVPAEKMAGSENRTIQLKFPHKTFEFDGVTYLTSFVFPNFYFHLTTAYDILRHNRVELGKQDFLGGA